MIYTRTGDQGSTALFGGTRVSKNSVRVEAYGAVDEANCALGAAKAELPEGQWRDRVHAIQQRMFVLAAELASDEAGLSRLGNTINDDDVATLEKLIDDCTAITGPQRSFVVPGRDRCSAAFHYARTVLRRAERRMMTLQEQSQIRGELIRFVNRASDAIYALARLAETWSDERLIRNIVEKTVNASNNTPGDDELRQAQSLITAAFQRACTMGVPIAAAVVDRHGNLTAFARQPHTLLGSTDIAINKAWTATAFRQSTAQLGGVARDELPGIETTNDGRVVLFGGGVPLWRGDTLTGGFGISGGTVAQDCEIVHHALAAIGQHSTGEK